MNIKNENSSFLSTENYNPIGTMPRSYLALPMGSITNLLLLLLLPQSTTATTASPPVAPSWPSPLPRFPSSWFGANVKTYEFEDPNQLALLRNFTQVMASWPELVLTSNFSNATAIAIEDATTLKSLLGPKTSVFTYQSMWVGAGYYDEVWELMQNPEVYSGFFVPPNGTAGATYDGYCSQVQDGANPKPPVNATTYPRCLGYYWNWCNQSAIDYYVNTVMRAMVADADGTPYNFDGVFLDNTDGFNPPRGSNISCDVKQARLNVHIELGKMFQKYKKWPVYSFSPSLDEVTQIWEAGVGFTKFYEYFVPSEQSMWQLYNDTELGLPTIVHAPTAVKRHAGIQFEDALAAFLVATGGASHSYFQYSAANWVVDSSWKFYDEYAVNYGVAKGPPTQERYGPNSTGVIWKREFANGATVSVNCSSWTWPARAPRGWCVGNIAGGTTNSE